MSPVLVLDVVLDEGEDVGHNIILAAGGQQHHAHTRRLVLVPVVLVVKLLLQTTYNEYCGLHTPGPS